MNQCEKIYDFMKNRGSITPKEAEKCIGCMRLASRISDMKAAGVNIGSKKIRVKKRDGDYTYVSCYWLSDFYKLCPSCNFGVSKLLFYCPRCGHDFGDK